MAATTSYEIALTHNGVTVEILGYSERRTKGALLRVAGANAAKIMTMCTDAELGMNYTYRDGVLSFGSVTVRFNGFTKKHPSAK